MRAGGIQSEKKLLQFRSLDVAKTLLNKTSKVKMFVRW